MTAEPCPRCQTSPIEAATMGEAEPSYLPACACYPHPPLCIGCRQPLEDGRCEHLSCRYAGLLQPAPIVDPLWVVVAPGTTAL